MPSRGKGGFMARRREEVREPGRRRCGGGGSAGECGAGEETRLGGTGAWP